MDPTYPYSAPILRVAPVSFQVSRRGKVSLSRLSFFFGLSLPNMPGLLPCDDASFCTGLPNGGGMRCWKLLPSGL